MAKQPERKDLKVVENKHIDDGHRAEDGRDSVSPGPQRKHDTAEYHEISRAVVLENAEPVNSVDLSNVPGLTGSATEVDRANDPKAKPIVTEGGVARESK